MRLPEFLTELSPVRETLAALIAFWRDYAACVEGFIDGYEQEEHL